MTQSYVMRIDVVENGFIAELEGPLPSDPAEQAPRRQAIFGTAYLMGQWLDKAMPAPDGGHNTLAAFPRFGPLSTAEGDYYAAP